MPTRGIVEPFNVVEHFGSRLLVACAVVRLVRALDLQRREEALDGGVVPALALFAHATGDALIGQ